MRWQPLSRIGLIALGIGALVLTLHAAELERPTRSQCIVGFKLDWAGVSDPRNSRHSMMQWPERKARTIPIAVMTFGPDGNSLYMQFWKSCRHKRVHADKLVDFWRSLHIDLPKFTVLSDPIEPSPDTIDAKGKYWKD